MRWLRSSSISEHRHGKGAGEIPGRGVPIGRHLFKRAPQGEQLAVVLVVQISEQVGAPADRFLCESIKEQTRNEHVENLAGQLSFLESAALMQGALMNYVNDSAPMHIASSMNAPVAAVFCSTVPEFGFGPLSEKSFIIQTPEKLECRPCGLHGNKNCPRDHFKCAFTISIESMLACLGEQ